MVPEQMNTPMTTGLNKNRIMANYQESTTSFLQCQNIFNQLLSLLLAYTC